MLTNNLANSLTVVYSQAVSAGQRLDDPRSPFALNSTLKPVADTAASARVQPRGEQRNPDALTSPPDQGQSVAGEDSDDPLVQQRREQEAQLNAQREKQRLLEDQRVIAELSARDREVRAHEQAHAAVGGQYAGAPAYQFKRGPDGVNYAVSGEVSIDAGPAATPQETIVKAQIVRRAALAPAEPSPQDRRVAAQATRMESQARAELNTLRAEEAKAKQEARAALNEENSANEGDEVANSEKEAPSGLPEPSGRERENNRSFISSQSLPLNSPVRQILSLAQNESSSPGALLDQLV